MHLDIHYHMLQKMHGLVIWASPAGSARTHMLAPTESTITAKKRTLTYQVQVTLSKISKELLKLSILSCLRSLSMLGIPDGGGSPSAVVSPIPRACSPGCPAMPTAIVYAIASSLVRLLACLGRA